MNKMSGFNTQNISFFTIRHLKVKNMALRILDPTSCQNPSVRRINFLISSKARGAVSKLPCAFFTPIAARDIALWIKDIDIFTSCFLRRSKFLSSGCYCDRIYIQIAIHIQTSTISEFSASKNKLYMTHSSIYIL